MGTTKTPAGTTVPDWYGGKTPKQYSTTPQYTVPSWYGTTTMAPPITPVANQPADDPMALLASILGQAPPDFNNQAQSQLNSVYAPQFGQINNAKGQAQKTKKQNEAQLNQMYAALGKDISAQSGQIEGTYNTAKNDVNTAYSAGRNGIANAYNSAAVENANLLRSLGIQQAAKDPRLNQQQQAQSAFLQGLMSVSDQSSQNALSQEQKAAQDYNTAQRGVVNAQQGEQNYQLSTALTNRMNDLANQGIALQGSEASAVQQLAAQLSGQYQQQQTSLADKLMQQYQQQQTQSNSDRQYQLDLQKFGQSQQDSAQQRAYQQQQQDFQQMGPADKGYYEASQLFGQNSDKASKAVNLIEDVGSAGSYRDAFQFAQAVADSARKNGALGDLPEDQLKTLAIYWFKQLSPQTTPAYLNGMG